MVDKVAVVIPYFDAPVFVDRLLVSLRSSTAYDRIHRIYIVDNSHTAFELKDINVDRIEHIRTRAAIGYGRACNIGVDQAIKNGATYILVTNQDVQFDANCIGKMLQASKNKLGRKDVITPMQHTYDLSGIDAHFQSWILDGAETSEDVNQSPLRLIRDFSGACFCMHRTLFEDIGLFDPVFYMYGEDDDLRQRMHETGGRIYLHTKAIVGHWHGHQKQATSVRVRRWKRQAQLILNRRGNRPIPLFRIKTYAQAVKRGRWRELWPYAEDDFRLWLRREAIRNNKPSRIKERIALQITKDRSSA